MKSKGIKLLQHSGRFNYSGVEEYIEEYQQEDDFDYPIKDLKESFTYSGKEKTWRKARQKAKKEGRTFSEVVELLLQEYIKSPVWKSVETGKHVPTFPTPTEA
jgi:hypothetical protein